MTWLPEGLQPTPLRFFVVPGITMLIAWGGNEAGRRRIKVLRRMF